MYIWCFAVTKDFKFKISSNLKLRQSITLHCLFLPCILSLLVTAVWLTIAAHRCRHQMALRCPVKLKQNPAESGQKH